MSRTQPTANTLTTRTWAQIISMALLAAAIANPQPGRAEEKEIDPFPEMDFNQTETDLLLNQLNANDKNKKQPATSTAPSETATPKTPPKPQPEKKTIPPNTEKTTTDKSTPAPPSPDPLLTSPAARPEETKPRENKTKAGDKDEPKNKTTNETRKSSSPTAAELEAEAGPDDIYGDSKPESDKPRPATTTEEITPMVSTDHDELARELSVQQRWTPFQMGLYYPIQIFSRRYYVKGWRWGWAYTINNEVNGFDMNLGFSEAKRKNGLELSGAALTRYQNGVQIALFGNVVREMNGVQLLAFTIPMKNTCQMNGLSCSLMNLPDMLRSVNGLQFGGFTSFVEDVRGAQTACCLAKAGEVQGFQAGGGFASAEEIHGVQLGLVAHCEKLHGFQFGLLCFAEDNWLPFFPGLNFGF